MVSVSENTNCRNGPGKTYDYLGALMAGESAEVVGQSTDGLYWIIKNPDRAGECWLWGQYASVTGPTVALPKFTPPPTPTPAFNWAGYWTITYSSSDPGSGNLINSMNITVVDKAFSGIINVAGDIRPLVGQSAMTFVP